MKKSYDADKDLDLTPYTCHDVAGLLKLWLGELPDPLFTSNLYQTWLEIEKLDAENKIINSRALITTFAPDTQNIISRLFSFLHLIALHSEKNKMPVKNLAVVFAPTILSPPSSVPISVTLVDLPKTTSLLAFIIENQEQILKPPQIFV